MKKNNTKNSNKVCNDVPLLPIGSVEKATKLDQKILLEYEEKGVLDPIESVKGKKYYTLENLERIRLIKFLIEEKNMNYESIKAVISVIKKNEIECRNYIKYVKKLDIETFRKS